MIVVLYAASPCRTRAGLNIGSGETRPSASGSVAPIRWGNANTAMSFKFEVRTTPVDNQGAPQQLGPRSVDFAPSR